MIKKHKNSILHRAAAWPPPIIRYFDIGYPIQGSVHVEADIELLIFKELSIKISSYH